MRLKCIEVDNESSEACYCMSWLRQKLKVGLMFENVQLCGSDRNVMMSYLKAFGCQRYSNRVRYLSDEVLSR
jgi:hypothetical protein